MSERERRQSLPAWRGAARGRGCVRVLIKNYGFFLQIDEPTAARRRAARQGTQREKTEIFAIALMCFPFTAVEDDGAQRSSLLLDVTSQFQTRTHDSFQRPLHPGTPLFSSVPLPSPSPESGTSLSLRRWSTGAAAT